MNRRTAIKLGIGSAAAALLPQSATAGATMTRQSLARWAEAHLPPDRIMRELHGVREWACLLAELTGVVSPDPKVQALAVASHPDPSSKKYKTLTEVHRLVARRWAEVLKHESSCKRDRLPYFNHVGVIRVAMHLDRGDYNTGFAWPPSSPIPQHIIATENPCRN